MKTLKQIACFIILSSFIFGFVGVIDVSGADEEVFKDPTSILQGTSKTKDAIAKSGIMTSGETALPNIIGNVIKFVLGFLGIIAVILIITGGFMWMTSMGNPEKVSQAAKLMANAAIGLLIIIGAYAITFFIIQAITGTILKTT